MKRIIDEIECLEIECLEIELAEMGKRYSKRRLAYVRGKVDALQWVIELSPIELDPVDSMERFAGVKHICFKCGAKLEIGIGVKEGETVVEITVKACGRSGAERGG